MTVGREDHQRLLAFRTELRRFIQWSEGAARAAGLTPALHQLLLAIEGGDDPSVGAVAEALLIKHHTAVELAQRAEDQGLVTRDRDGRRVLLALTPEGAARLDALSAEHLDRIGPLAARLRDAAEQR